MWFMCSLGALWSVAQQMPLWLQRRVSSSPVVTGKVQSVPVTAKVHAVGVLLPLVFFPSVCQELGVTFGTRLCSSTPPALSCCIIAVHHGIVTPTAQH